VLGYRGYVPPFDGMRGVAILAIMVLHFFPEASWKEHCPTLGPIVNKIAQMGISGVELFFVLSGFLVSGILLDRKDSSARTYFSNFYARRSIRLYPLYYGVLFVVFFVVPLIVCVDSVARELYSQQWRLWLNLTNVPINKPGWDSAGTYKLGHFWFLAAQEQFYLIWPLMIFICSRRMLSRVCIAFMIMGNVARVANVIGGSFDLWVFRWSTVSKIDGLALGALLAVMVRKQEYHRKMFVCARWGWRILAPLFAVIMLMPRRMTNALGDQGMIVLEPVMVFLFASMLILALERSTSISKGLCNPVLRWFGKYSYGMFIIHGLLRPAHLRLLPPDMYVAVFRIPVVGLALHMATCIAVSVLLAYVSWHCYEKHFLKLKKYFAYGKSRA